jgi:hypothetical protein
MSPGTQRWLSYRYERLCYSLQCTLLPFLTSLVLMCLQPRSFCDDIILFEKSTITGLHSFRVTSGSTGLVASSILS